MAVFQLDRAHTNVNFSAKHLMVTNVRGEFLDFDADLDLDEADPTSVERRVPGPDRERRHRLRRPRQPPALRRLLRCRGAIPRWSCAAPGSATSAANDYTVTADVTIRDVTRPVDASTSSSWGSSRAWTGRATSASRPRRRVNRKDWGLDWNVALEAGGWLVGDEIRIDVEVAAQERIAKAA